MFMTGTDRTMNAVKAMILMATRKELTVALSFVPTISSMVTTPAMIMAGRLITPPSNGPSIQVSGMFMLKACSI